MFARLTEPARQVVVRAREEARLLGHPAIGTEHLLLGVVHVDPALLPIAIARAREPVVALRGPGTGAPADGEFMPFTPEAKRSLELAAEGAGGERPIAPAHLVLGLLDAERSVAELLADFGLEPLSVREQAEAAGASVRGPRDPLETLQAGDPLEVVLGFGNLPLGDFGNRRVDARLLLLMLEADTKIGRWLRERGIDEAALRAEVPELD